MKNSTFPDNVLLEIASRFKKHLKDHLDILKIANPDLNKDFIYRFKALFYEAQMYAHPHHLDTEADRITQKLKLEMEDLVNQIKYWFEIFRFNIQKAFPYDSKMWEAYGHCEVEKAFLDYSEFRTWLEGFLKLTNEKRTELIAANCPTHTLDQIVVLSKLIGDKHEELQEYLERKEIRSKASETNLNELFKLMKIVHKAASQTLQDNPKSLKQLTLPPKEPLAPKSNHTTT